MSMEERDKAFERWYDQTDLIGAKAQTFSAFCEAWSIQQKRIDELEDLLKRHHQDGSRTGYVGCDLFVRTQEALSKSALERAKE